MEDCKEVWVIIDWTYNRLFGTQEFESFEDGWEYIYENIEDIDNAYDDVFVVLESENLDKINRKFR